MTHRFNDVDDSARIIMDAAEVASRRERAYVDRIAWRIEMEHGALLVRVGADHEMLVCLLTEEIEDKREAA